MPGQYIESPAGRLVVLPEAEYREMAEMLADADAAAEIDRFRIKLAGENPVRVWRETRGLKASALKAPAEALNVTVDDLV